MNEISYVVERNPSIIININQTYYRIQTIGDPHLGKAFKKLYGHSSVMVLYFLL